MPAHAEKPQTDDAKLRLIRAAEKLMVERGVDNVSLRQIGTEAGQKNAAALQYHFGTRQELVWAILTLRVTPVDERRQAMLAFIRSNPSPPDINDVSRALITPLTSSLLEAADAQTYFARFLARAFSDPDIFQQLIEHPSYQSVRDLARLYGDVCPQLSRLVISQRIRMATAVLVMEAAEIERELAQSDEPDIAAINNRIGVMIDSTAGLMAAPLQPSRH